jgi:UDP-glucose 4-epimerase
MKILETGGAGFIGSHVGDRLIKDGHKVIVVDNLTSSRTNNINSRCTFYNADIRSSFQISEIIKEEKPDAIIHLAAQKSVPLSVENPAYDADINIMGMIHLLSLAASNKISKFIFSSSGGAIYGNVTQIPIPETCIPRPISPYAISKYTGEKYVEYFSNTHNLSSTILRFANVYGPRQKPQGECGVIPIYLKNILEHKPSYLYTYPDMPIGVIRDYIYVDDVVQAIISSLYDEQNETYNIGTGVGTYTEDVYNILATISQTSELLNHNDVRHGDVRRNILDISKAKSIIKWQPEVELHDGLAETYKYEKNAR